MKERCFPFSPLNHCPLRFQAINQPSGVAISHESGEISFSQLDKMVEHWRTAMESRGLKAGDRVLFITSDSLKTIVTILACLRSQWVFSPINPAFPEEQRQNYAEKIGAGLITDGEDVDLDFFESHLSSEILKPITISENLIFDLIATSGTTGTPKAVAHSYKNHFYSAAGSKEILPLSQGDTWLLSLPLFHVGGLAIIIRCVLAGATIVLFQQKKALTVMLAEKPVSHLSLVNTQLFRLMDEGKNLRDIGVRHILLGGGIASPMLVEKVRQQGVNILTTYGMTEMASQICTGEPEFVNNGVTSGKVLPYRELTLSDSNEILVRGETLALGYFERGTIGRFVDNQGWFHTGDKGQWYGKQIKVSGRIDNMMISGGENIHPEEIEQVLLTLPGVVQAVVVAIDHQEFGQRPLAYVQTTDGKVNESEIKERLIGKLPKFKIPEHIRLFPNHIAESGIKVNRKVFQNLD